MPDRDQMPGPDPWIEGQASGRGDLAFETLMPGESALPVWNRPDLKIGRGDIPVPLVKAGPECHRLLQIDFLAFEAVDHHEAWFGHVLNGVAQTLSAEAGILDAAIGHVVDAIGGDVVDHDASCLDLLEGDQRSFQVIGEDAGL